MGESDEVAVGAGRQRWMCSCARLGDDWFQEVRRRSRRFRELRGKLAEHEVMAAFVDQAERGDIPECRGAAVAEDDLPTIWQSEQVPQA